MKKQMRKLFITNLAKKLLIIALLLSSTIAFGACPYRTGGDATHQGYWGKCAKDDYWKWIKTVDYTFKQHNIICVNPKAALKVANALEHGNTAYLYYVRDNSIECSLTAFWGGAHLIKMAKHGEISQIQYSFAEIPRDYTVYVGWIPTAWLTPRQE